MIEGVPIDREPEEVFAVYYEKPGSKLLVATELIPAAGDWLGLPITESILMKPRWAQ